MRALYEVHPRKDHPGVDPSASAIPPNIGPNESGADGTLNRRMAVRARAVTSPGTRICPAEESPRGAAKGSASRKSAAAETRALMKGGFGEQNRRSTVAAIVP